MSTHHLDPTVYGGYSQRVEITIRGAHIRWAGIPASEHDRILPIIRRQLGLLADRYDTSIETGPDYVYLDLRMQEPATAASVLTLKGDVFTLLVATSWGGP